MNLRFQGLFLIFLMLISGINAIELNIQGEIKEYSKDYTETLNVNLDCNEDILINTPSDAINIYLDNYSTKNKSIFINNCINNSEIKYTLSIIEEINTNRFRLERNFNNYGNLNYTFKLKVPIEYNLDSNNSVPKDVKIKYFESYKVLEFNSNELFVLYFNKQTEDEKISLDHMLEESIETNAIILALISFLLGSTLTYLYMNWKLKNQPQKQVPSYILSKEDKEILDVIKQDPGINQKQIGIKLNMSKSRVSHIISDLEQKQLIKREKFGRSFKVYLNKKIV